MPTESSGDCERKPPRRPRVVLRRVMLAFQRQLSPRAVLRHRAACVAIKVAGALLSGCAAAVTAAWLRRNRLARPIVLPVALTAVLRLLEDGRIQEMVYSDNGAIVAHLKPPGAASSGRRIAYSSQLLPGSEATLFDAARRGDASCRYSPAPRAVGQIVSVAVPFLLLAVWYRVLKSLIDRNERYVPPSRPAPRRSEAKRTSLADVVSKSKVELAEIVDFLNSPEKFLRAGARLPRGALLVGPSGTGKTLLARAVAGEAHCAFISASASEFVEVYVGRGAARVRDLFRQARESAPAVLFIDELDAVGSRARGGGLSSNEEYVQTLNQLLTELDGFYGQGERVVVLAATNRREAIDPALLRPGRFDRNVFVELPDEDERLEILALHAARAPATMKLEASGALARAALITTDFSGAELANVVNEAVFLSLRAGRAEASVEDLDAALERTFSVRQRSSASMAGSAEAAATAAAAAFPRAFFRSWPVAAAQ